MPSCDGSNCGACACSVNNCTVSKEELENIEKELNKTKRKLKKVLNENKKLRNILVNRELSKSTRKKRKLS